MTLANIPLDDSAPVSDAEVAVQLARAAGARLQQFRRDFQTAAGTDPRAANKALRDAADADSQSLIDALLTAHRPADAVLSEEAEDSTQRDDSGRVWIIDPLDGTWEYGLHRDDWAVHVALWQSDPQPAGEIVLGVVAVPDADQVFTSASPIALPQLALERPMRIIASRSRPPKFLPQLADRLSSVWSALGGPAEVEIVQVGSVGAKVARLLTGQAEVYVHDSGFYEWDVAAPLAVARAAGLAASHLDGSPVTFNHRPPYVTDLMVARPEVASAVQSVLAGGAGEPATDA